MENKSQYFEFLRALHRGGLSLWLNRRTLLPMAFIPTIVTFLTLMVMRGMMTDGEGGADVSSFVMALIQIPADFVTGVYCSLIIFIIMSAPSKKDTDAPVMFSLNIMERKDLLIAGAIAHVIFGYFASGLFGIVQMIMDPVKAAADSGEPQVMMILPIVAILVFIFYAIRFALLPILIIGKINVADFYRDHKKFGFSFPILLVKIVTAIVAGAFILMISSLTAGMGNNESMHSTSMAIIDIATSLASVLTTVWAYAALSIGIRQLLGGAK